MPRLHAVMEVPAARYDDAADFWDAALGEPWPAYLELRRTAGSPRVRVEVEDGPAVPAPEPATWPDGHRSRLVQVCIDSPVDAHDADVASWRERLGERWATQPA